MTSQMRKIKKIKEAIKNSDIEKLILLGKKHGFINNKLRKLAWPLVLNVNKKTKPNVPNVAAPSIPITPPSSTLLASSAAPRAPRATRSKSFPVAPLQTQSSSSPDIDIKSADHYQIEKDIGRSSLNYYKKSRHIPASSLALGRILHDIFDNNNNLHYIQGYNDVTSVLYTVCNNEYLAKKISKKIAKTKLSQYIMNNNYDFNSLNLIFKILSYHDTELNKLFASMSSTSHGTNTTGLLSFAVSWIITWFAHQIKNIKIISRIYDYCLCSNKLISVYLSSSLILYFKNDLLKQININDDSSLHSFFQNIKWDKIDFNKVISTSELLYNKYPTNMFTNFSNSNSDLNNNINNEIKENLCDYDNYNDNSNSNTVTDDYSSSDDDTGIDDAVSGTVSNSENDVHVINNNNNNNKKQFASVQNGIQNFAKDIETGFTEVLSWINIKNKVKNKNNK